MLTFKLLGLWMTAELLEVSGRGSVGMRNFNDLCNFTQDPELHILLTRHFRNYCNMELLLTAFVETYAQWCLLPRFAMCMWIHMHSVSCESEVEHCTDRCHHLHHHSNSEHLSSVYHVSVTVLRNPYVFSYAISTITLHYLSHILIQNVVTIIVSLIHVRKIMPGESKS